MTRPAPISDRREEDPILECIVGLRSAGAVRCSVDPHGGALVDVVRRAGLRPELARLHAIDGAAARRVAIRILHRDLAYARELMDESLAETLVDKFFQVLGSVPLQYYTNGTFDRMPLRVGAGLSSSCSWLAMTEAAYDTGILVLGSDRSGYLWVEDED